MSDRCARVRQDRMDRWKDRYKRLTASEEGEPCFGGRAIFCLVWPLLLEQLLNVLIGMVDILMVASLGEAAVSGVSLIDSLNTLIFQVLFAIANGGTVVISRFVGARDRKHAGKASAQLLMITVGTMFLFTFFMVLGRRPVLSILYGSIDEEVMRDALTYLALTALSYPALALYNSSAAGFRASGDSRTPLFCSVFMNLLNILGNAIGIYILHMGVAGVAIPTLISRCVGGLALFYLLQTGNTVCRINRWTDFIPDGRTIAMILSIGIPNGVENGVFQFGKLILSSLVATLGTAAIAGYAVACNLANYFYLPGNALGAAMLTIVGQCLGAGERKQAKGYARLLVLLNYLCLLPICLIMYIFNHQLVAMYHLSGQSASYACGLLIAHTICMIIWPLAFQTPYYFRASGRAAFTMLVAISDMWICRVGLAYLFVKVCHQDVLWIWYAMFVDWIVRVIVYVTAFRKAE